MADIRDVERLINLQNTVPHRARCTNIQVRVLRRTLWQFRQIFPMHGALAWFVRSALEEVAHQGGDITEEEHIHFLRGRVEALMKKPKRASSPKKW